MLCVYDRCYSDSECLDGTLCECRTGTQGNGCLYTGCRVDADCPGSWCSPTMGACGAFGGIVDYECHTPEDECTDDGDCVAPGMGTGYCMYSELPGHWVCSYSSCAG